MKTSINRTYKDKATGEVFYIKSEEFLYDVTYFVFQNTDSTLSFLMRPEDVDAYLEEL